MRAENSVMGSDTTHGIHVKNNMIIATATATCATCQTMRVTVIVSLPVTVGQPKHTCSKEVSYGRREQYSDRE
jgi:hypothetical protein